MWGQPVGEVKIGASSRTPGNFEGRIDEVRISNRALSSAEIETLASPEPGLVAYYPFEGNTLDESGNAHDGVSRSSSSVRMRTCSPSVR